jgi:hypothetical protein
MLVSANVPIDACFLFPSALSCSFIPESPRSQEELFNLNTITAIAIKTKLSARPCANSRELISHYYCLAMSVPSAKPDNLKSAATYAPPTPGNIERERGRKDSSLLEFKLTRSSVLQALASLVIYHKS